MNMTSTTTYSQRIVAIPPMSSINLSPQDIGLKARHSTLNGLNYSDYTLLNPVLPYLVEKGILIEKKKKYEINGKMIKKGDRFELPKLDASPISVYLTYSLDEGQSATQSMKIDFFVHKVIVYDGYDSSGMSFNKDQSPLYIYVYSNFLHKRQLQDN